ncbi:hypothetical protein [Roseomonas indoligenes]|uniref:Uncharacterized protein n=1 Tax=Roseomonas indoligenes TaxID=2820811 RepID=A0A940S6N0_9PROT|nr:hypothetical protein [Pararoseomonas indoligenes]MBP0492163.1 hypothetical protein [Pararoseomonas indoligenes]
MSAADDLAGGVQALTASVRAMAADPGDQLRLLTRLSAFYPADPVEADTVGAARGAIQDAMGALCRRAALVAMARAVSDIYPASYDEAVALRDLLDGLLEAEILIAGDLADDASGDALRRLKTATARLLTDRAANLARLQTVSVRAPLPALVHAYRLYADLDRADELTAYAGAADPNFMPDEFQARGR